MFLTERKLWTVILEIIVYKVVGPAWRSFPDKQNSDGIAHVALLNPVENLNDLVVVLTVSEVF